MQNNGFQFEDEPYDVLAEKYPNCAGTLKWWCNLRSRNATSMFNINRNKYLKEFMVENPPWFRISDKCCEYAKKSVARKYIKENSIDLEIIGIRKSEGGVRSVTKSCFEENQTKGCAVYKPIFLYLCNIDSVFLNESQITKLSPAASNNS